MKSRLSALNYVKNNKKTVGVLIIALALSFMAMYAVYVLLATTIESFKPIMLEMPKKVSYISLCPKTMGVEKKDYDSSDEYEAAIENRRDEIINELKKHKGIEDAYFTQILRCRYKSVIGQWAYEFPITEPERIPQFLEHTEAKLIEGRLPSGDGEILVDSVIMKNQNLKVGDWFMESWFGEVFKVTGVIESKYMVCIGTPMGYTNSGFFITVLNDENTSDMNALLLEQGIHVTEEDEIDDAETGYKDYKEEIKDMIEEVISVINLVVMVFLAISVLVAYISFMRNRINEYCLYSSIGYSRADVYGMMIREMFIIFGIGIVLGIVLSIAMAYVINRFLIEPKGLITHVVYGERIFGIIASYVFVMGILQLPVLFSIQEIKTIDVIDD